MQTRLEIFQILVSRKDGLLCHKERFQLQESGLEVTGGVYTLGGRAGIMDEDNYNRSGWSSSQVTSHFISYSIDPRAAWVPPAPGP